jgi:hypothetical protein
MDAEPKAIVYPSSQFSRLGAGDCLTRLVEEVHDIIGEFMGALGAAFLRHESLEALRGTLVLQVIKVAPREAKVLRRLGHRAPRPFDAPEHLILHLERVLRIKKGMGQEQVVLHWDYEKESHPTAFN